MTRFFTLLLLITLFPILASAQNAKDIAPPGTVLVPGGTFIMGDLFAEKQLLGQPLHSVTISSFYLGKTEVTFDDFDAFCTATQRDKPSDGAWGRGQRPVIYVNWYDAIEYCNWLSQQHQYKPFYTIITSRKDPSNKSAFDHKKWLVTPNPDANGYRLPTEAEWEYAAREGGKKVRFGNGKNIADYMQINFAASSIYACPAVADEKYRQKTVEVGSLHSPNALGLHDMSGNVIEWCADWYGDYSSSAQTNPTGAMAGEFRVLRGGRYFSDQQVCGAAARGGGLPEDRTCDYGFRIAANVPAREELAAHANSKPVLPIASDRDKDGITDDQDACPDEPGLSQEEGCPIYKQDDDTEIIHKSSFGRDREGDHIVDRDDLCPDVAGLPTNYGCPQPIIPDAKAIIKAATSKALPGMVFVKGATFTMGDLFNDSHWGHEVQHQVTISDFYMGKMEVTFDEFDAFCLASERPQPSDEGWGRGDRPVIYVHWYDAIEYCNWLSQQQGRMPVYLIDKSQRDTNNHRMLDTRKWIVTRNMRANGYRLPTEAEWEYAAREGGQKVRFGHGKNQVDPAQVNFDARLRELNNYAIVGGIRNGSLEVGGLNSPNALGLHDMSGNVSEWCADWYGDYSSVPQVNPTGPVAGSAWVVRGGSWKDGPSGCRNSCRYDYENGAGYDVGFRLVLSAQ